MILKMLRSSTALAAFSLTSTAFAGGIVAADVERIGPNRIAVTWSDEAPVDVFASSKPDATFKTAKLISDNDRDGRHEMTVDPGARVYFLLRDENGHQKIRVAERLLPLEQGSNFRDVGGYPAAGGKHIRWGLIYRSGATPMLTDADIRQVQALGLRNMIDLRSNEERVLGPSRLDGIRYSAVGYSLAPFFKQPDPKEAKQNYGAGYPSDAIAYVPQFRILFETLLAREGPLVFNCSAGQDRTGLATALILIALGVPRDIIYQDYHLSTRYRRPQYEMPPINIPAFPNNPVAKYFAESHQVTPKPLFTPDGKPLLGRTLDEIEKHWGSVENYLKQEIGVDKVKLASLRAMYLE